MPKLRQPGEQRRSGAQTEQMVPTIGGPIYRYRDKRLALIECRGCKQFVRGELDG